MQIIPIQPGNAVHAAPLVAAFRVALKRFKGIRTQPDEEAGLLELQEYLEAGFPCFAALEEDEWMGYIVCRVDAPTVWVESLFVREAFRRQGVATALFRKAEEIAASYGETTVFNYVHPNNHPMISFLRRHGYTVLNLLEIRKPWPGEQLTQRIPVGNHEFDY